MKAWTAEKNLKNFRNNPTVLLSSKCNCSLRVQESYHVLLGAFTVCLSSKTLYICLTHKIESAVNWRANQSRSVFLFVDDNKKTICRRRDQQLGRADICHGGHVCIWNNMVPNTDTYSGDVPNSCKVRLEDIYTIPLYFIY